MNTKLEKITAMTGLKSLARSSLLALAALIGVSSGAQAANLISNPGFEDNPPSAMANNIGHPVTPWIIGTGGSSNVVKVDGPGGYDYYSNGPESDGSAPDAGIAQHYLDIANGSNDLYQSFTVPACPASPAGTSVNVLFTGKFSTRAINIGYPSGPAAVGKVKIVSGTGTSGSVIASQTASLTAGPSKTSPWVLLSGTANVTRGSTFSYVVTMDDNVNFDDAVLLIEADPCDTIQPPVENKACLKGDTKVTCGATPGTFIITLAPNGAGGMTPASVQVTSLTPGVTIVSPASNYPVVGGQVKITLAGATPGQTVSLQVDGSTPNPQSENGMSICCNGKIEVTIPKNLDCWKSTISIVKTCEPAVMGKYPVSPVATGLGLHANCTITVTTTGPQSGPVTVGDTLLGTGTVVNMTAPAPWTCTTPTCQVNGANLNQTSSTTVISAIAVFANPGDAMEAKNCAKVAAAGKPKGESCVPIVYGEQGKLTVTKEAAYNGSHITNVSFPIAVTCGANVTNASFADGAPYVQGNIPLGTQCSVAEGAAPPTGLCGAGQQEVWTTTYAPATPVAITAAGAAIKVKNLLTCKKVDSTIDVIKTCNPVKQLESPVLLFGAKCKIIVKTTGPQTGTITMADTLTGGGTITSLMSLPSPAWPTCTNAGCSIPGSQLNQTASTSVFDVFVTFPTQGHAMEAKQCAKVSVNQMEKDKACTNFTVADPDKTSISITKKVEIAGPANLNGIQFPITFDCGAGVQSISLANGQAHVVNGLAAGTNCTVTEGPITANPCGGGATSASTATWLAPIYLPSQTVAAGPGASVTVVNRVMCEDLMPAKTITVTKRVVSNAPDVLPSIAYPVTATCGSNVTSINDGQTLTIGNLAAGTACTITEGPLNQGVVNQAALDACGGAGKPVWTTSYAPSQTVNTGGSVTITNTLDCEPVNLPSPFYVFKEVISHAELPLENMLFTIESNCTGANPPSLVKTVPAGQGEVFQQLATGASCTVTETPPGPTNACGNMIPKWTVEYYPSATFTQGVTYGNSVVVRNTLDCVCPDGQKKANGTCIATPAPVKCDPSTTTVKNGQCACKFANMAKTSSTSCGCAAGFKFAPGRGCFKPEPVCGKNQVLVKGECRAKQPACGKNQALVKGECRNKAPVCGKNQVLVKGRCVNQEQKCGPRQIRVKGRCINVPKCGFGQIPVPGTGICVSVGIGGGPKGDHRP